MIAVGQLHRIHLALTISSIHKSRPLLQSLAVPLTLTHSTDIAVVLLWSVLLVQKPNARNKSKGALHSNQTRRSEATSRSPRQRRSEVERTKCDDSSHDARDQVLCSGYHAWDCAGAHTSSSCGLSVRRFGSVPGHRVYDKVGDQ